MGIGQFCHSIVTSDTHSAIELFLIEWLLIAELNILGKGVNLTIHQSDQKLEYYVQARCVLQIMDSVAIWEMNRVQRTNSYAGCCFCYHSRGIKFPFIKQVNYGGVRKHLDSTHEARYWGQSELCCPYNYNGDDNFNAVFNFNDISDRKGMKPLMLRNGNSCDGNKLEGVESYNSIRHRSRYCDWDIFELCDVTKFSGKLYFHNCDLRTHVPFTVKTHEEYIEDVKRFDFKKKEDPSITNINGVLGCNQFATLYYWRFDENSFGPFHTLFDLSKQFMKLFKGNRSSKCENLSKYCKATNTLPCYLTRGALPWDISALSNKIDAFLQCIVIPSGMSNDCRCKSIFQRTSYLGGGDHLYFITCLLKPMVRQTSMPDEYKEFFILFSEIVIKLQYDSFEDGDIDKLVKQVIELKAIHEGLFPPTEYSSIFHQLIHVAHFVKKFGPIRGYWEYPGERIHSLLKGFLTKGGINADRTMYNKYVNSEMHILKHAYSGDRTKRTPNKLTKIIRSIDDNSVLTYGPNKELIYDIGTLRLQKETNYKPKTFNAFEMDSLLKAMVTEVRKQTADEADASFNSSLYRLYISYQANSKNYSTFWTFIEAISKMESNDFENKIICNKYDIRYLKEGFVYQRDLKTVKELTVDSKAKSYDKAIVYGSELKSRGAARALRDFDEIEKQKQLKEDQSNWWKSHECDSWCQYRFVEDPWNIHCEEKILFAQINYFFRFQLPNDNILNGVPFASVVTRKTDNNNFVKLELASYGRNIFIPVTNIVSTRILLAPYDSNGTSVGHLSGDKALIDVDKLINNNLESMSYFQPIARYPQRIKRSYNKTRRTMYNTQW